jgi:hypothetical protein
MQVSLFIPCLVDQFHARTAANMIRVLKKLGLQPHYPNKQTCCGQPFFQGRFMILIGSRFYRQNKSHFGVYHMLRRFLLDEQVAVCHTKASRKQVPIFYLYVWSDLICDAFLKSCLKPQKARRTADNGT